MLTIATLGMAGYGVFSAGAGLFDLVGTRRLELWADGILMLLGAILLLAAAFVRVLMPGGLALAIGSLLGLQALALHNTTHLYQDILPWAQVARGAFAGLLVLLAYLGAERARPVSQNRNPH